MTTTERTSTTASTPGQNGTGNAHLSPTPTAGDRAATGAGAASNELPQRLILLCDGTWENRLMVSSEFKSGTNTSEPLSGQYYTNVAILNMAIPTISKPDENGQKWRQICYYISGIGAGQLSLLAKAFTGATGAGVSDKLQQAYGFLCDNYQAGDEILLFGFSRGAYTARAIAGFINWGGIFQKASNCTRNNSGSGQDAPNVINEAVFFNEIFEAYEKRDPKNPESIKNAAQLMYDRLGRWPSEGADDIATVTTTSANLSKSGALKNGEITVPPYIKVVGVWDTVGALGIPGFFQEAKLYSFLDAGLSSNVQYAFQALALAEDRKDFLPTLWYKPFPSQQDEVDQKRRANQVLKQMWFNGCHGDVGGGEGNHGLSDITLAWMVAQLLEGGGGKQSLLDVNLDVLRSMQDQRKKWAMQLPNTSRAAVTFQETRDVKAKPEDQQPKDVVWKNNVYTGLTNEHIHHSVVISNILTPNSPQFRELKSKNPGLLLQLWKEASDPNSLLETEKQLAWQNAKESTPKKSPPGLIVSTILKTIAAVTTLGATIVADVVNLRIIPKDEQANLKVVSAEWARKKLRGE
ncbi:unnamed protein product [Sympodiomycopsis kandeliae]